MRLTTIKKWSLRIGGLLTGLIIIAALALIFLLKVHMHGVYGGDVKLVEHSQFRTEAVLTAITNVSVLSPNGEEMLSDRTVIIEAGEIVSIAQEARAPEGALIIDGRGKFLIPGFVDSHVHLRHQPNDLLLYVANGVTHIRDLSGSKSDLALRKQVDNGRVGPRMFVTSPTLYTAGLFEGWFNDLTSPSINVRTAKRAEALVRSLADAGYDSLKTYDNIDMDTYRAINSAAIDVGLHTIGHLPNEIKLEELALTEQQEIAHIEEIVKALQDEFRASDRSDYQTAFPAFVEARAEIIADDLLANDITINSTLWYMELIGEQAFNLKAQLKDIPLEYANPGMVEGSPYTPFGWLPGNNNFEMPADVSSQDREEAERSWEVRTEAHRILYREMVQRGVRIIAGSDATVNLIVPGFSLHSEMESLTRNGMTPAQSLRATTATPAMLMSSNAGIIEAGRRADLVLLNENPLIDIENTESINTVILNGRVHDRAQLDKMLEAVKAANASSREFDLNLYQ